MTAAYSLLLRLQASRGRLLAVGALGALVVLVAVAVRISDPTSPTAEVAAVNRAGLALFVPITALVFATAVLGEMAEDGTLVYVWARPVRRLDLALAAMAASLTVTLPCVLATMGAMAVVLDPDPGLVAGTLVASTLSTVAHTALFVGLGVRVPRALLWGLAYVAVWEGIIAGIATALARTSLRLYANSLLREMADAEPVEFAVQPATAVIVLTLVTLAGLALTTLLLERADVP
jgi:ABC-2 type transport system permease protein